MTTELVPLGSKYLEDLIAQIRLPESVYCAATKRYEGVGEWLEGEKSPLARHRPLIYPQGSIALGTAIRPLVGDEHDVDAVCLLRDPPYEVYQRQLKRIVGERLKEHPEYRDMLNPQDGGRRCWTLEYPRTPSYPAFHLDILPAIRDDPSSLTQAGVCPEWAKEAIRITDKTTWGCKTLVWPTSNPKGFLSWFRSRMTRRLREAKIIRGRSRFMTVEMAMEKIPDYEVRTPLQGAVQILKFHRDLHYAEDPNKPISIIISTLAGLAYQDEDSVASAVLAIVPRMRNFIQGTPGNYRIDNPADLRENFAERWADEPKKSVVFLRWLRSLEDTVARIEASQSPLSLLEVVEGNLNHRYARTSLNRIMRHESLPPWARY